MRAYIGEAHEFIHGSCSEEQFILCLAEKGEFTSFDYFVQACLHHMEAEPERVQLRHCAPEQFNKEPKGNLDSLKERFVRELEEELWCLEVDTEGNPFGWAEKTFFAMSASMYVGFNWTTSA